MCWVVGTCSGAEGEQKIHPPCSNPGEPRMHKYKYKYKYK